MMAITEEFISRREKYPQLEIRIRSQIDKPLTDSGFERAGGQGYQTLIVTTRRIRRRSSLKEFLDIGLIRDGSG